MRALLTSAAIFLILCMAVAFAAPFFVDWTTYRSHVETAFSRLTGIQASFSGPIDIQFLPSPHLSAKAAIFTFPGATVSADEVEIDPQPTRLLTGEVSLRFLRLVRPVVRLSADATNAGPASLGARLANLSIDDFEAQGARLIRRDASGADTTLADGVDFAGSLDQVHSSLKGALTFGTQALGPLSGQFAMDLSEAARFPLQAVFEPASHAVQIHFDGDVSGLREWIAGGAKPPDLRGKFSARGPATGLGQVKSWSASGDLAGKLPNVALSNVSLRLGAPPDALEGTGTAQLVLTDRVDGSVTVNFPILDLDKALHAQGAKVARPSTAFATLIAGWGSLSQQFPALSTLDVDFHAKSVILGAQSLTDTALSWRQSDAASAQIEVRAAFPGAGAVNFAGNAKFAPTPGLEGQGHLDLDDAQRWAEWWTAKAGADYAALQPWTNSLGARRLGFDGDIAISPGSVATRAGSFILGQTTLKGPLSVEAAYGAQRARIQFDLVSPKLDFSDALDVPRSLEALSDVDLDLGIKADAVAFQRVGQDALQAGAFEAKVQKTSDSIAINRVHLENFGGATLDAQGQANSNLARFSGALSATSLADLSALARKAFPSPWSSWLSDHAAALSPANLKFSLGAASLSAAMGLDFNAMEVGGSVSALDFAANRSRAPGSLQRVVKLNLNAKSADAIASLLDLSGASAPPGAVSAAITLLGDDTPKFKLTAGADGAFGTMSWTADGTWSALGVTLAGNAKYAAPNITPLLDVLGAGTIKRLPTDLPLRAEARLVAAPGAFELSNLSGSLGGDGFSGGLRWTHGPQADGGVDLQIVKDAAAVVGDAGRPEAGGVKGALNFDLIDLAALMDRLNAIGDGDRGDRSSQQTPVAQTAAFGLAFDIALGARQLRAPGGATIHDVHARVGFDRGSLSIEDVAGALGDGHVSGTLSINPTGDVSSVTGEANLDQYALPAPFAQGKVGLNVKFATTGSSPAQWLSGLSGWGRANLSGAKIAKADASALRNVVQRSADLETPIDEKKLNAALLAGLGKADLALPDQGIALALSGGVATATPIAITTPAAAISVNGQYDIARGKFSAAIRFVDGEKLKFWTGEPPSLLLNIVADAQGVGRSLDVGPLVSGLTAQAIERSSDAAENFAADIRERAYFIRREKAERFLARRQAELAAFDRAAAQAAAKNDAAAQLIDPPTPPQTNDQTPRTLDAPGGLVKPKASAPNTALELKGLY